jgi:SAM-dependent methyltransferase
MVEAAQAKLATLDRQPVIKVVDAQAIPFEDETFDAVIANHMLYHVPDRLRALGEMRRVLRSDGAFYATTVGDRHMMQLWSLVEPFVPDIHERTGRVSRGFTLENGERSACRGLLRHHARRLQGRAGSDGGPARRGLPEILHDPDGMRPGTLTMGDDPAHGLRAY